MPTLRQRVAFIATADIKYTWLLLLRKLGVKRLVQQRGGRKLIVPLNPAGGVQLAYTTGRAPVELIRALRPQIDGTFVDVGANVGLMLVCLRLVDETLPWIGFEPSAAACEYIRELIRANGFEHTTLIEAGLSDLTGDATLFAASGTDSSATMIRDFQGDMAHQQGQQFKVRVLGGAELGGRELAARTGFVKIDVEGMELEVVRGLKAVLQRDRPLMFFEVIPVRADGSERASRLLARQAELIAEVRGLDYRLAQVWKDGRVRAVETPDNDADLNSANYLGIPAERFEPVLTLLPHVE